MFLASYENTSGSLEELKEKCYGKTSRRVSVSIAFSSSTKLSRVFFTKPLDFELEIFITSEKSPAHKVIVT